MFGVNLLLGNLDYMKGEIDRLLYEVDRLRKLQQEVGELRSEVRTLKSERERDRIKTCATDWNPHLQALKNRITDLRTANAHLREENAKLFRIGIDGAPGRLLRMGTIYGVKLYADVNTSPALCRSITKLLERAP